LSAKPAIATIHFAFYNNCEDISQKFEIILSALTIVVRSTWCCSCGCCCCFCCSYSFCFCCGL